MKKFAICCLAVAAAVLFVPAANAAPITTCYHLTYFCDGVQSTQIGGVVVGLWDWVCLGAGTGTVMGGVKNKFGTNPTYPFSVGTPLGAHANFYFKPTTATFNLTGTVDGVTFFYFQKNSPYTTTAGPCSPLGPKTGARPALGR